MSRKGYLALATGLVYLISYQLRLFHLGSDMGQILPTANIHRDHSILYALVYETEFSHIGKNSGYTDLLCKNMLQGLYSKHVPIVSVLVKA